MRHNIVEWLNCGCFVGVTGSVEASSNGLLPIRHMPDCVMRRSSTYADSLLAAMSELHTENVFCDVTLISEDGAFQTKVHKVVLVATSAYLKSLLLDPDLVINDCITVPSM